jgi:hypothetical protein
VSSQLKFEHKGHEFYIYAQKNQGLGWCWAVEFEGRSLRNTMNEEGKRSQDRAYSAARQWIRDNV